jgi:hypothetical protein
LPIEPITPRTASISEASVLTNSAVGFRLMANIRLGRVHVKILSNYHPKP